MKIRNSVALVTGANRGLGKAFVQALLDAGAKKVYAAARDPRSIKIPGVPADPVAAKLRVERLRALIPARVTIGVSGDAFAATGLSAGCEAWYSVVGGLFPKTALAITQAVRTGNIIEANRLSDRLEPLWAMFRRKGSIRVMATAAELEGLVSSPCLPLPLRALEGIEREELQSLLAKLELTE